MTPGRDHVGNAMNGKMDIQDQLSSLDRLNKCNGVPYRRKAHQQKLVEMSRCQGLLEIGQTVCAQGDTDHVTLAYHAHDTEIVWKQANCGVTAQPIAPIRQLVNMCFQFKHVDDCF